MYAPSYAFGAAVGPNDNSVSPPFLAAPSLHQLQLQPQPKPHPHPQEQHQPAQQQMIYHPQYTGAAPGPQPQPLPHPQPHPLPQQSPYRGSPAPGMNPNAGAMGIMQNAGMAHMPGGHVASYQTPYSTSPYGPSIPTSSGAQLPPNFMATTSNPASISMNASMNPQQMQAQRMQPPPSSAPTQPGQRASPYGGMSQNTPPNAINAQSRFNSPQATQNQGQMASNTPQNQTGMAVTPQAPTFPAGSQNPALATPLSPGSEVREKERVTLMLEINSELLMESLHLQSTQLAEKKEEASPTSPETADDKEKTDKATAKGVASKEYIECMRRLQVNLAYLAAIADRHKPASQIPPHPAIMSAPPLSSRVLSAAESKSEGEEKTPSQSDTPEDSDERVKRLNESYKRLQALFPGVDPKKDVQQQHLARQMQVKQQQAQAQAQALAQQGSQAPGGGGEQTAQQKMQQDLYRQRIMQQAQHGAVASQQQGPSLNQ